jgi:hypothetical protein
VIRQRAPHARHRGLQLDALLDLIFHGQPPGCMLAGPDLNATVRLLVAGLNRR